MFKGILACLNIVVPDQYSPISLHQGARLYQFTPTPNMQPHQRGSRAPRPRPARVPPPHQLPLRHLPPQPLSPGL
eukprot:gene7412-biopygen9078